MTNVPTSGKTKDNIYIYTITIIDEILPRVSHQCILSASFARWVIRKLNGLVRNLKEGTDNGLAFQGQGDRHLNIKLMRTFLCELKQMMIKKGNQEEFNCTNTSSEVTAGGESP